VTWSKFDDLYDEHEKVEDAWERERATIGLHVQATTYCNRLLTDGVIHPRWLRRKLPERRERDRVLVVMVECGLFDLLHAGETITVTPKGGGLVTLGPFPEDRYVVHDFLDRHDPKAIVQARREAEAERKRTSRSARSPKSVHPDVQADAARTAAGIRAASDDPPARVIPTRPDPTIPPLPPEGGRKREQDRFAEEMRAWAAVAYPDLPADVVVGAVQRLRAAKSDVTPDRVRQMAVRIDPRLAQEAA
jgi:hypothetical protein